MSYHVPSGRNAAALLEIERIRVALDQANGLRDVAGNPITKTMYLVRATGGAPSVDRDVDGTVTAIHGAQVLAQHQRSGSVTSDSDVVLGDDGTAALALADELDEIGDHLGTTVRGQPIPSRAALVSEAALPARVKAELDRRKAVAALERALGLERSQ